MWNTLRPSEAPKLYMLWCARGEEQSRFTREEDIPEGRISTFSILDDSKGITRFFNFLDPLSWDISEALPAVASMRHCEHLVMAILERRREIGILKALRNASEVM